jgi:trimethylamine--corrinoid protein Co-methyltransferase
VDSKLCDAQAGYESLLTALPAALAGADLIYGTGMVDSGMALDYGKLVMDDEINRSIKHVVQGMRVTPETLSVDLIKEVGRTGEYLTHSSTLEHFAGAMVPRLMNRESHQSWTAKGASSLHERALKQAKTVLEKHHPEPLSEQAQKDIQRIILETEKEFKVRP